MGFSFCRRLSASHASLILCLLLNIALLESVRPIDRDIEADVKASPRKESVEVSPRHFSLVSSGQAESAKTACVDMLPDCASWATQGQCSGNPEYMHSQCKQSCGLCEVLAVQAQVPPESETAVKGQTFDAAASDKVEIDGVVDNFKVNVNGVKANAKNLFQGLQRGLDAQDRVNTEIQGVDTKVQRLTSALTLDTRNSGHGAVEPLDTVHNGVAEPAGQWDVFRELMDEADPQAAVPASALQNKAAEDETKFREE